ncbi:DUF397 domain-containing protein [Nocardiopsis alba]|jgi:hypothetical protein|uniref:DUF397 domain-containing protein n=1 Tax=Nocardiopsis alba TaxID=53437 RepID=A0A7K2IZ31_9ACTN|nr:MULTISPECIES: DUF397 domain-containing protein [Nocardiopsis]MEC3891640.1 DUF397 domain-containing protein [Nocardiopsis sp. LDBS1602]MYR35025.1 DUF397 domain-containing protein [Nocardiopsis alba]
MMNEHWKKSTYSNGTGGNCVEARATTQGAAVRDTQNRGLAELSLPNAEWSALLHALRTR